jgi:hypothetical protein
MRDRAFSHVETRRVADEALLRARSAGGSGPVVPNVVNITTPGTHDVPGNSAVFINLSAAGGDVVIQPVGFTAGEDLYTKLIGPAAAFTASINPLAGGEIENADTPGTLTSSPYVINGAASPAGTPGYDITFTSPDGTNLYY